MLSHLKIQNFAIISEVEIDFSKNYTAISGETGAGKSLILTAIQFALGAKTDINLIKHNTEKLEINATFEIDKNSEAYNFLKERDLDDEDLCIVRRIITIDGKSRSYINGTSCTLTDVRILGTFLVNIHSQHDFQFLLSPNNHIKILDNYAKNSVELANVAKHFNNIQKYKKQLTQLETTQLTTSQNSQLLQYQLLELADLNLMPNEVNQLENEYKRISQSANLINVANKAIANLNNDSFDNLLENTIIELKKVKINDFKEVIEMLDMAKINIKESISSLRKINNNNKDNSTERLNEISARLDKIYTIAKKHKIEVEKLNNFEHELSSQNKEILEIDKKIEELQTKIEQEKSLYLEACKELSVSRIAFADKLKIDTTNHLQQLGMQDANFEIVLSVDNDRINVLGFDVVEFKISTQKDVPVRALNKVASGGELSRISLSIEVATASSNKASTLIYDEVDVGIGGAMAYTVGKLLKLLGKNNQVIAITHLAQVAAFAKHHLYADNKASRYIDYLDENGKIYELARMMSGNADEFAIKHAMELIRSVEAKKI